MRWLPNALALSGAEELAGGLKILQSKTVMVSAAVKKRAYSARPLSGAGVFVLVAGF
jgi:hypothetical protein